MAFGTHCPTQLPPTHAELTQATGAPKVPSVPQLSTPLFEQVVAPGLHVPWHEPPLAPATHVWFEHATALPHWPFAWQVWTPLPEHVVVPGTHTPLQAPFAQVKGHALGEPHVPEAVHVATPLVELSTATQLVAFGAHTPWHDAWPLAPSIQA